MNSRIGNKLTTVLKNKTAFKLHRSKVTNIRPAKELPAAREHFGETSTVELFPRLNFAMRYQKLSPRLNHARITQKSYNLRQYKTFNLFQDSAVHSLLCDNNNTTRGRLQLH